MEYRLVTISANESINAFQEITTRDLTIVKRTLQRFGLSLSSLSNVEALEEEKLVMDKIVQQNGVNKQVKLYIKL